MLRFPASASLQGWRCFAAAYVNKRQDEPTGVRYHEAAPFDSFGPAEALHFTLPQAVYSGPEVRGGGLMHTSSAWPRSRSGQRPDARSPSPPAPFCAFLIAGADRRRKAP